MSLIFRSRFIWCNVGGCPQGGVVQLRPEISPGFSPTREAKLGGHVVAGGAWGQVNGG